MKKVYLLIALVFFSFSNAQCPAPTNLTVSFYNVDSVTLNWTETGSANSWEIAVFNENQIGVSEPTSGMLSPTNPVVINGLSPMCLVFYVRARCDDNSFSEWTKVPYGACSDWIYTYLSTPNNTKSNLNNNSLIIYPNPSNSFVQIALLNTNDNIERINFYDVLGKTVKSISNIPSNKGNIDVSNLAKGIYMVEIISESKTKLIKKLVVQ